jgi:hypothetical protein
VGSCVPTAGRLVKRGAFKVGSPRPEVAVPALKIALKIDFPFCHPSGKHSQDWAELLGLCHRLVLATELANQLGGLN